MTWKKVQKAYGAEESNENAYLLIYFQEEFIKVNYSINNDSKLFCNDTSRRVPAIDLVTNKKSKFKKQKKKNQFI